LEGENEATFKKLVMDAGRKFLKPLNPQYPMIEINGNCKIIGVVVDAKLANLP
ncbi:LexA family transcriptional repressor, partial [Salmonella enterica]|nr:LexA family transcriptional repressor [Salmonella enterica]